MKKPRVHPGCFSLVASRLCYARSRTRMCGRTPSRAGATTLSPRSQSPLRPLMVQPTPRALNGSRAKKTSQTTRLKPKTLLPIHPQKQQGVEHPFESSIFYPFLETKSHNTTNDVLTVAGTRTPTCVVCVKIRTKVLDGITKTIGPCHGTIQLVIST